MNNQTRSSIVRDGTKFDHEHSKTELIRGVQNETYNYVKAYIHRKLDFKPSRHT